MFLVLPHVHLPPRMSTISKLKYVCRPGINSSKDSYFKMRFCQYISSCFFHSISKSLIRKCLALTYKMNLKVRPFLLLVLLCLTMKCVIVRLKHHVQYPHYNQKYPETLAQCFIFCAGMMKTIYGYQKSP